MKIIYTHRTKKNTISTNKDLPTKEGDYIYFIRLVPIFGDKPRYKIGTTNRPLQRLKEHLKNYHYEFNIEVLWFSPRYSSIETTTRVERRMIKFWSEFLGWEYIPNDRFVLPDDVDEVIIRVRKDYPIRI